jgi:hypothetical protein
MVANHVFCDTDQVYHPTTSPQNHIGTIMERFPNIDVALVKLDEDVEYHNGTYFDAPTAKRLVTSQYDGVKRQDGSFSIHHLLASYHFFGREFGWGSEMTY